MNRNIAIWLALGLIVIIIFVYSILSSNNGESLNPSTSPEATDPMASLSPSPTVILPSTSRQPGGSLQGQPTPQNPSGGSLVGSPVPKNLITGPASCQLSGSIVFLSNTTYETHGAKIAYQNVDDTSRLIYWDISPNDGALKIGPNIFAGLSTKLPNGEKMVGADISGTPTAKRYTLTARITYGRFGSTGAEEVREASCTGSVVVTLP